MQHGVNQLSISRLVMDRGNQHTTLSQTLSDVCGQQRVRTDMFDDRSAVTRLASRPRGDVVSWNTPGVVSSGDRGDLETETKALRWPHALQYPSKFKGFSNICPHCQVFPYNPKVLVVLHFVVEAI